MKTIFMNNFLNGMISRRKSILPSEEYTNGIWVRGFSRETIILKQKCILSDL